MEFLMAGYWWLLICLLGALVWPLVFTVFENLPDRGYAWCKPLGLLFLGLISWLIGFWHFSSAVVWMALIALAGSALWVGLPRWQALLGFMKDHWQQFLVTEIFGLVLFAGAIWLRSHYPSILDGEKFMEMAFYNALSRAVSFPPYDPWMAGKGLFINYYYLGYLCLLLPVKLLGTATAVAFNIASALVFTLAGLAGFGLIYNLTRSRIVGLLGWVVLFLFGNLDACRQIIFHHGFEKFDWFASSRIIKNTITEFPIFSFLVGDLHPHVIAVPYFLIQIGCALEFLKRHSRKEDLLRQPNIFLLICWGLVIGSLGVFNTWDLPTAVLVASLAIFIKTYSAMQSESNVPWRPMGLILIFAVVPYLPHYLNFISPTQGVEMTFQNTAIPDYILMFGMEVFLSLGFTLAIWKFYPSQTGIFIKKPTSSKSSVSSRMLLFYGLVFVVLAGFYKSWLAAFLLAWILFLLPLLLNRKTDSEIKLGLIMLLMALVLSLSCEIFYIRDSTSTPPSERLHTVFKLYNQIWFLLGMAGVYGGYWIFQNAWRGKMFRLVFCGVVSLLAIACLFYPAMAIPAKMAHFKGQASLDGTNFLREDPAARTELEGINWLQQHVSGNPVILEATGYEYTFSARVSVFTGLPTVMGWSGHEAIWRGSQPEIIQRAKNVIQMYTTLDANQAQELMEKYRVEYVFVGALERAWYPREALMKFERFMNVVYQNSGVVILQRRPQL